jgi:hypothetical protein
LPNFKLKVELDPVIVGVPWLADTDIVTVEPVAEPLLPSSVTMPDAGPASDPKAPVLVLIVT